MNIRVGELMHFLPKQTKINQRMLRKWVEEGILRPSGGASEKSRFWFDEFEAAYTLIAAYLHDFGIKGLGHQQAMLWFRTRFDQAASHPIETALGFIKQENYSVPVKVGLVHAANADDGAPIYSVLTQPHEFNENTPCMLVLNLVQILKPLGFRL